LARHRVMLSRRVVAYYGLIRASESLPATSAYVTRAAAPKEKTASGGESEGPQITPLDCARVPTPIPRWPRRVPMTVASAPVLAFAMVSRARRPHWEFRGCRVHSFPPRELLRPAGWLALLSRTFTFELAPIGSPSIGVEYDYVGKQSIPTAGLSPASPTALWAARHRFPPSRRLTVLPHSARRRSDKTPPAPERSPPAAS
jgi:hypothetical protein